MNRQLTLFFVLVFLWIWAIAGFALGMPAVAESIFGPMSAANPLFLAAAWGPNVVALVLTARAGGGAAVLQLLRKFVLGGVGARWYAFTLLGIPAMGLAAALLAETFASSPLGSGEPGMAARLAPIVLSLLYTGALGEELGWRGYALPRLLERRSPLMASLILGGLWGLWHLPAFLASGTPQSGTSLPAFVLGAATLSTVATWVFLHTRGSVLLAAMLHFAANFALSVMGAPMLHFAGLLLVLCAVLIISRRDLWFATPTSSQTKPDAVGPAAQPD